MLKTYHGSCHCGGVHFEAPVDLDEGIRKCNCSYCWKTRLLKAFAYGDSVRVTKGEELLTDYRAEPSSCPPGHIQHRFCRHCGTQLFSRGFLEIAPFNGWFDAVNVATLDNVTDEEIAAAPVIYEDGRHDRQDQAPTFTAHL